MGRAREEKRRRERGRRKKMVTLCFSNGLWLRRVEK
jgi:hypothetical protein